jgi:hypothetical protein
VKPISADALQQKREKVRLSQEAAMRLWEKMQAIKSQTAEAENSQRETKATPRVEE